MLTISFLFSALPGLPIDRGDFRQADDIDEVERFNYSFYPKTVSKRIFLNEKIKTRVKIDQNLLGKNYKLTLSKKEISKKILNGETIEVKRSAKDGNSFKGKSKNFKIKVPYPHGKIHLTRILVEDNDEIGDSPDGKKGMAKDYPQLKNKILSDKYYLNEAKGVMKKLGINTNEIKFMDVADLIREGEDDFGKIRKEKIAKYVTAYRAIDDVDVLGSKVIVNVLGFPKRIIPECGVPRPRLPCTHGKTRPKNSTFQLSA